ncbi:MAG: hypothetical protein PVJ46_12145 [Methyloceanibacter sp.]|jgi:uncharacterized membrane protein
MEIFLAIIFAAAFLSGVFVMMRGIYNQSAIAVISGSLLTLIGGGLVYFFLG